MTIQGQHGQPKDYAKGCHLIRMAAMDSDENAPQGAYVCYISKLLCLSQRLMFEIGLWNVART
jgi:hypothetical protein